MSLEDIVRRQLEAHEALYRQKPDFEIPCPHYFLYRNFELFSTVPLDMPRPLALAAREPLASLCDEFGVNAFLHVSEAWAKTEKRENIGPTDADGLPVATGSLADDPESKEVFVVTGGTREGRRVFASWNIDREARTGRYLVDESIMYSEDMDDTRQCISKWDLWDRPSLKREVIIGEPDAN